MGGFFEWAVESLASPHLREVVMKKVQDLILASRLEGR